MNSNNIQIQLDKFEGPLSLLLYLIRKNEIDIYDIPVHEITKQYLEYIQIMRELNLEVAGEFIAMAASLILIKSRMLVPQYNEDGEVIEEDPRKELVQKLLEYQKFQAASQLLGKRSMLNKDIWGRGTVDDSLEVAPPDEIILDEGGLFALIGEFRRLLKQAEPDTIHEVRAKGMSISARMLTLKNRFVPGNALQLSDLLEPGFTKSDLIVTFLSVLELARLQYIRVFQTEPYAPVHIETLMSIDRDIVSRVQEFDYQQNVQSAAQNFLLAQEAEGVDEQEALGTSEAEISETQQLQLGNLDEDAEIQALESGAMDNELYSEGEIS